MSGEAILTPEEHASITGRFGATAKVYELGGRRWCLRKPRRPEWQAFKVDQQSQDATTRADAPVTLAKALLVPVDPNGTVDAERKAFDDLSEEYPALIDVLGVWAVNGAEGPFPLREIKPPASTPPV